MISIIHFCSKLHPFSGNIFNHFEYFIFLLKLEQEVELCIVSDYVTLGTILEVMEDRYDLEGINYKPYIKFSMYKLSRNVFDKVITNTKVFHNLNGEIIGNEMHIVHTWASFSKEYKTKLDILFDGRKNIIFYNENKLCGEVNYIRPIYLKLLKKPRVSEDNVFLHIAGIRRITLTEFIKFVRPKLPINKKVIVSYPESQDSTFSYLKKINNVEVYKNHVPKLFERYNTYFYIMLHSMDYSPRMIIENYYFKKKLIFVNVKGYHQRLSDILNCDIEKYHLTDNDLLIRNVV